MANKTIRTTFFISEFTEQEKWLEVQHKSGWKFIKTDGKTYEFEKCPDEDWIYQLDFKENGIAEDDYLQMFTDYGWEYIQHSEKWFYFRKKKVNECEDYSIFSDNESKIDMCKRVIKGQFLKTIPLPVICLAAMYYLVFFTNLMPLGSSWRSILLGVCTSLLLIIIVYINMKYCNQYKRIKQAIKSLKNPVSFF